MIYSLRDYKRSKKIIKDIPHLLIELEKAATCLYDYNHYIDIANCLYMITEAHYNLEKHYNFYMKVHQNKGRIDGKKESN